jgi:hypothetical protein
VQSVLCSFCLGFLFAAFEVKASAAPKTYFSEITNSILDAKFSADGRYLLVRLVPDYCASGSLLVSMSRLATT